MINKFRGEYSFLSNFYNAQVAWEGLVYCNNEAAFQSAKVLTNREQFINLSPSEAKKLGRRVKLRCDWEVVKDDIMYQICLAKFTQNKELRNKLLATGDEYIAEENDWGDTVWGTVNGYGQNRLGKILMRVRDEIREMER